MSSLYRYSLMSLIVVALWATGGQIVYASVSNWQNGFNVAPRSADDFSSGSFKQSMQNMRADGVNAVAFVIPYYQSTIYSTDVGPGWNTPSDVALASAIDYAHSIGLMVTLKPHVDPYDGSWRASINPGDRQGWFNNYGNILVHVSQIAQAHHAEVIVLGTEMVSMAADNMNPTNTQNWINLIGRVRGVYSGKLTYGANSSGTDPSDTFSDEKAHINFWSYLDYAGISAYYSSPTIWDNSVNTLVGQWNYWNNNDIAGFARIAGKPILITEVGYRSISQAHQDPWNWWRNAPVDQTEQANDYQALMQYWNNYSYIVGTYWWDWSTDPNAGGAGDTSYTPQHKQAEQIIKNWMTNPTPPNGGNPPLPSGTMTTDVWWPTNGAVVSGTQPFKVMVENIDVSQYQTWWQVDGDRLNPMYNSAQDYPHKEAMVDLSGWYWRGSGPYVITFISKNAAGTMISQKSVTITVH